MSSPLQYVPFSIALDGTFWSELSKRKLEQYRLEEGPVLVSASFSCGNAAGLPPLANMDHGSFELADLSSTTVGKCPMRGNLWLLNTLEAMKQRDKVLLLQAAGEELWQSIRSGQATEDPNLLNRFVALIFADLKTYRFWYWFAFPAVRLPEGAVVLDGAPRRLDEVVTEAQLGLLDAAYCEMKAPASRTAFLVRPEDAGGMVVLPLAQLPQLIDSVGKFYVCFSDPSTSDTHPGWPLRNLLALLAFAHGSLVQEWDIVCYRRQTKQGRVLSGHSLVLKVRLAAVTEQPGFVGWERNAAGQLGPRTVDLKASMDPARLCESAVNLNLQLMRWRLAPSLDLQGIAATRCLLLGAGTLGCNVARGLMAWGIRTLTIVDCGRVSYSNPVRQSLYTLRDCKDGGRPKAQAAADALRDVFPSMNTRAVDLSIPMPGHAVPSGSESAVREQVEQLERLVAEHDAIFLLLDTREARWLPTLLASSANKLAINAALGFDTFLVMRHGVESSEGGAGEPSASRLGCYFCNDVVGPADSTKDRTLDQQCTVTRPGVSMVAAALAVELLACLLQHPLKGGAPAATGSWDSPCESPLGMVPHQIRGFLSRHHYMTPSCTAFSMCTACSPRVISEYRSKGWEFVLEALNHASYLEQLTGLSQLHAETNLEQVWALSDSEED